jgi:hypothetical protein
MIRLPDKRYTYTMHTLVSTLVRAVSITLPAPDDIDITGWTLLIGGLAIMALGFLMPA